MATNVTFAGDDVCTAFSDFIGLQATALAPPFANQDQSASGSPTLGHETGTAHGELSYIHAATNEEEIIGLTFGDAVAIPATAGVVFEARVKLVAVGGAMATARRMLVGLASAHANDVDAITQQAWFLVGNAANLEVMVESDDGTTNTDDQETGVSIDDSEYMTYRIDMTDTANIRFIMNGTEVGTTVADNLTSSHLLQPYICIEKDSGTTQDELLVDYCRITWRREE